MEREEPVEEREGGKEEGDQMSCLSSGMQSKMSSETPLWLQAVVSCVLAENNSKVVLAL